MKESTNGSTEKKTHTKQSGVKSNKLRKTKKESKEKNGISNSTSTHSSTTINRVGNAKDEHVFNAFIFSFFLCL